MMDMVVSREVGASPERVWEVVTDLRGAADRISAISRVEIVDGGDEFGVGTTWRETRQMFGRETTEVMQVTAVDPGRSYTVASDSRGAHYRSVITVEPRDGHTNLSMTFGGEPQGAISKVMAATVGRLFAGATRRAIQQDLDDIAAAAEAGG